MVHSKKRRRGYIKSALLYGQFFVDLAERVL